MATMQHNQRSLQERRTASLAISISPGIYVHSPSPLTRSETRSSISGLSSGGRFLWAPPVPSKAALPSPMLKAEREHRTVQPRRWTAPFTTRSYAVLLTAFAIISLLYRNDILSLLRQHSEPLPVSADIELPAAAGPVSFVDQLGRQRWTLYIPESAPFPLPAVQYRAMYDASRQLSSQISGPQSKAAIPSRLRNSFSRNIFDESFMDIEEAQRLGVLPWPTLAPEPSSGSPQNSSSACRSSLTFVLGTGDVRFGKTLLALWLAYGVAQEQGRAFFVDDSMWPYGRYNDFFKPLLPPTCRRPSNTQAVPYPRTARHLIVSASSWAWTIGDLGHHRFSVRRPGRGPERALFSLARRGHQDLFHLTDDDQAFVDQRVSAIRAQAAEADDAPVVAVHVRRGDLHPLDWIYIRDYLPYERYTEAALEVLDRSQPHIPSDGGRKVPVLLGSDDPDTIVQQDFLTPLKDANCDVQLAQSRIVLASQRSLDRTASVRQASGFIKHVDEASGWEGGFFATLFNGLGKAPSGASIIDDGAVPDLGITDLKRLIGRAYLLDLAIMGHADAVVCAASSSTCRALGVMMGWPKVSHGTGWINVDDGQGWTFA